MNFEKYGNMEMLSGQPVVTKHKVGNVRGDRNKAFLICLLFYGMNVYLSDFVIVLRWGRGDGH